MEESNLLVRAAQIHDVAVVPEDQIRRGLANADSPISENLLWRFLLLRDPLGQVLRQNHGIIIILYHRIVLFARPP